MQQKSPNVRSIVATASTRQRGRKRETVLDVFGQCMINPQFHLHQENGRTVVEEAAACALQEHVALCALNVVFPFLTLIAMIAPL